MEQTERWEDGVRGTLEPPESSYLSDPPFEIMLIFHFILAMLIWAAS